jgi:hypothetical protein
VRPDEPDLLHVLAVFWGRVPQRRGVVFAVLVNRDGVVGVLDYPAQARVVEGVPALVQVFQDAEW